MNVGIATEAENRYLSVLRSNWKLILLLLIGVLFYARALTFGFVYDDVGQILTNPRVQHLHYLPGYFTQHLWAHNLPPQQGSYYRPFFLIWLLINYALFGVKAWAWHATTLLAQLCATVAVFRLTKRLVSRENVAWLAAALFLLHPLAIQSTVWISDVDDSLCLLLMICAFISYLNARECKNVRWLAGSLALFASAMLMKETAFVLVAIIPCYAWLFQKEDSPVRRLRLAVRDGIPYLATFLVFFFVRNHVLGNVLHAHVKASLSSCLITLPSVLWLYSRNILLPNRLALFYDLPYVATLTWSQFWMPLLAIAVLGLVLAILCWRRLSAPLVFGFLWVAIIMGPPLATIPFFGDFGLVHDRYFYAAMPGLALILALLWERLALHSKALGWGLAIVLLGAAAVLNWYQQGFWRSNEALYTRSLAVSPGSTKARLGLAWERMGQANYAEASTLVEDTLKQDPANYNAYFARFVLHEQLNNIPAAEADARKALEIRPDSPEAHAMIANALFLQGHESEGQAELLKAIALYPSNLQYHLDLASSYRRQKNMTSALAEYRTALSILPEDPKLRAHVARFEEEVAAGATTPVSSQ